MDQLKSHLPMMILFTVLYVASFQVQVYLIYPLELELGWEITHKASIFFIPAGVQLLAFYFLRLWFIPVAIIGRTILYMQFWGGDTFLESLSLSIFVALIYPLLLRVFQNAGWNVFGTEDDPRFTVTGIVIFQTTVTLAVAFFQTGQLILLDRLQNAEAFQYTVHLLVGDVLGAVGVMYLFYVFFKYGPVHLTHKD